MSYTFFSVIVSCRQNIYFITHNALMVIEVTTLASATSPSVVIKDLLLRQIWHKKPYNYFHRPHRGLFKGQQTCSRNIFDKKLRDIFPSGHLGNINWVPTITCFLKLRLQYRTVIVLRNFFILPNINIKT